MTPGRVSRGLVAAAALAALAATAPTCITEPMRIGTPGQVCAGECLPLALTADEVLGILTRGVLAAQALNAPATLAVVDHVGNVLGVCKMAGARESTTALQTSPVATGLQGLDLPADLAAISKAGTAAYLSTQGNAFSTRTASQIVQQHFNPGERFRPGGPLFGVQFSQLPCGDLVQRDPANLLGPKRMPLGFSADPGGLPLYLWGLPVGGIGVELDGVYDFDPVISDFDADLEERIAGAATAGFAAPTDRRADRIAVDGRYLRFADDERGVATNVPFPAGVDCSTPIPGFWDGTIRDGALFWMPESGIVPVVLDGLPAEVLVDAVGERYPPRASSVPGGLTALEVQTLLRQGLGVAAAARAQIRRPAGSAARVTVSVVDTTGAILGVARNRDAPIFGIDVSLQKARTAAFFSAPNAAADLEQGLAAARVALAPFYVVPDYVAQTRAFLSDPNALTGGIAFSDRANGNLSRPFFPDGIDGRRNGPLSRPLTEWSPFSTGLQLDLVAPAVLSVLGGANPSTCTDPALSELANGIQIFPGSVPIYRGSTLVGGIGVSGDGVDQDDLIAFLGLHRAGLALGGAIGNAPRAIRADVLTVDGVNLRYVNCPPSPFNDSSQQNVCEGK